MGRSRWWASSIMLLLLPTEGRAKPVLLGTVGVLAARGDAVWCCATNQGVHDITLLGVNIFDRNGALQAVIQDDLDDPPPPLTLPPKNTRCVLVDGARSTLYRCEVYGEGPYARSDLTGVLMIGVIGGDPNRVHALVEAHRIARTTAFVPSLVPCGQTFPECNGSCPFGSGYYLASSSGICFCGIR